MEGFGVHPLCLSGQFTQNGGCHVHSECRRSCRCPELASPIVRRATSDARERGDVPHSPGEAKLMPETPQSRTPSTERVRHRTFGFRAPFFGRTAVRKAGGGPLMKSWFHLLLLLFPFPSFFDFSPRVRTSAGKIEEQSLRSQVKRWCRADRARADVTCYSSRPLVYPFHLGGKENPPKKLGEISTVTDRSWVKPGLLRRVGKLSTSVAGGHGRAPRPSSFDDRTPWSPAMKGISWSLGIRRGNRCGFYCV